MMIFCCWGLVVIKKKAPEKRGLNNNKQIFKGNGGREERIRTSDPSVPNAVLYQTEPLPDFNMLK